MSTIIEKLEKAQLQRVPSFDPGDRVRVHFQVVEGTRRRTQVFEGVVIKRQGSGVRETFTVRKQSFGVGVERTFPVHSTKIEKIEIAARGEVRRAKLYYLRDRVGKRARVRERAWTPQEQARLDAEAAGAYDEQGAQEEAEIVPADEATPDAVEETTAETTDGDAPEAEAAEASVEEAPVEEAAAEEPPAAEEAAAEPEAPADEAPAEEPAAEETPAAETPAEEAAAEEAPAAEESTDDAPSDDAAEAPEADAAADDGEDKSESSES